MEHCCTYPIISLWRTRFKTFFRTHPSATLHNPTRIKLFKEYNWKRIAIINQDEEVFSSTAKDLIERLLAENMTISTHQPFHSDPKVAVNNLKKEDARIIVGLFYEEMARKVMCDAHKEKLFGKKYVWFLIGWYKNDWYRNLKESDINCTVDEMKKVVQNHFTTEIVMLDPSDKITISDMKPSDFNRLLNNRLMTSPSETGGYNEASLAYDAIWAIALALKRVVNQTEYKELTRHNIGQEMHHSLSMSNFPGISGQVMFDSDGSKMAWTRTEYFREDSYETIMEYDYSKDNDTWKHYLWRNSKAPKDSILKEFVSLEMAKEIFFIFACLNVITLLFVTNWLVFNIQHRKKSSIVGTASELNSLSLSGGLILLASSLVFLLDLSDILCQVRAALLMIGFSIAYSPLFTKLWIVHSLHKKKLLNHEEEQDRCETTGNVNLDLKIEVKIKRSSVMVMLLPLFLDILAITLWMFFDKLEPILLQLESQISEIDDDVTIIPRLEMCQSDHLHIWIMVIFGYKGIQLLLGSFLAYESRMKIQSDTDHRVVAMAVFNITVLCICCAPVAFLLRKNPDLFYVFVAAPVIVSTIASSAIIFIPKWKMARSDQKDIEEKNDETLQLYNEILREQIEEVDRKIKALRQRRRCTSGSASSTKSAVGEIPSTAVTNSI